MPPGLFEMLSVRAHREKHNLKFLAHWGDGFHARHKKENVQVISHKLKFNCKMTTVVCCYNKTINNEN